MSNEESRILQAHKDRLIKYLAVNKKAKETFIIECHQKQWFDTDEIPDEERLVNIILNRISNDPGQLYILIDMMKEIVGSDIIVKKINGMACWAILTQTWECFVFTDDISNQSSGILAHVESTLLRDFGNCTSNSIDEGNRWM